MKLMLSSALLAIHMLATIVWVGGMFFTYMILRPAGESMPAGDRLELWERIFVRFFAWVWLAVIFLLITGYALLFTLFDGLAGASIPVHLMNGIGLLMVGLYVKLFLGPYRLFRHALAAKDLLSAVQQQIRIRRIVAVNLVLGLLTVAIATAGRHLP